MRLTPSVVAVIPARWASTRFPGKPIALIAGVPMVVRVITNLADARLVDRTLVATDDERIADVVTEAGGEAVMTASDLPSGTDRVWAAAPPDAEIIVNVQADEPMLPGRVVDALVARLRSDQSADVTTPVIPVSRAQASSPDVVTVALDDSGTALYFSRQVIPSGAEPVWRHLGVYAYRRDALRRFVAATPTSLERAERLEQLRALSLGLRLVGVEVDAAIPAVDRPDDVVAVERLLRVGTADDGVTPAVRLLVLDADGVLTDGRILYTGGEDQTMGFDVKDGFGIVALLRAGVAVAIISARDSPALRRRAEELGITALRTGITDKAAALVEVAEGLGITLDSTLYVGDDAPDVPAMALAGWSAAPADASPEALAQASLRLTRAGGRGAVREVADAILGHRLPAPTPNAMPGLRDPNAMPGLRDPNAMPGLRDPNAMPGPTG